MPRFYQVWAAPLIACLLTPVVSADVKIALKRGAAPDGDRFEVTGLGVAELGALKTSDRSSRRLLVYVDSESDSPSTPLFGEHRFVDSKVVFEPRFPLQAGLSYRAEWRGADQPILRHVFHIPKAAPRPLAEISGVFPTRDALPENQLKFYIHFSAPMSRGEAYRRITLYKQNGEKVDYPFLELDQELWDSSGRRFTLFFDPGRVKRGLRPREELGPALEEGRAYRLVIDKGWPDAHGQALKASFVKRFRVTAPDYRQPDPTRWQVKAPGATSSDALQVLLDEPLDHALLNRVVAVASEKGDDIPGSLIVDQQETRLLFRPERPWEKGTFAIVMDTILEDLAGNSIARPFEVDIFRKVESRITTEVHRVWFTVK